MVRSLMGVLSWMRCPKFQCMSRITNLYCTRVQFIGVKRSYSGGKVAPKWLVLGRPIGSNLCNCLHFGEKWGKGLVQNKKSLAEQQLHFVNAYATLVSKWEYPPDGGMLVNLPPGGATSNCET